MGEPFFSINLGHVLTIVAILGTLFLHWGAYRGSWGGMQADITALKEDMHQLTKVQETLVSVLRDLAVQRVRQDNFEIRLDSSVKDRQYQFETLDARITTHIEHCLASKRQSKPRR